VIYLVDANVLSEATKAKPNAKVARQEPQRERAEREFATLSRMQPANLDEVRRWFNK
jgi:hypothetical protein